MSLLGPDYVLALDSANPGSGPVSTATVIAPDTRSETYMSMGDSVHSKMDNNFIPTINAQNESSQQYVNDKYVNFTGREQINPTVVEQVALKGDNVWNNLSINDAKTTTNETTLYSYSGNAEREDLGSNWWRYSDSPKITTNETTLYSYSGNAEREDLGSNWWRYSDSPKITTNETTLYSYSGNAEREDLGSNWWRYSDSPKITTNETTLYSYSGDVAPVTVINPENRELYTGDGHTSGVTNWGQKGITLVEDYVPGPNGSVNIQLDADEKIGYTLLKDDQDTISSAGSGTYLQATPNATHYQQIDKDLIGEVIFPPNKNIGIDDRQVSNYVINNLTENPLSVYRNKQSNDNKIPSFFVNTNPTHFNSINQNAVEYSKLNEYTPDVGVVNIFEDNKYNPNEIIVMNTNAQENNNIENPMLFQNKVPNNKNSYLGKAYSGNANNSGILLDSDSYESSKYIHRFEKTGCLKTC